MTAFAKENSIRLGLCCIFREQPIKFSRTTATAISRMPRPEALAKLSRLCLANANSLLQALAFCADHRIGCFRITSQILPLKSHPSHRYRLEDLPEGDEIVQRLEACRNFARQHGLRTSFHPDQFVVLNSPRPEVVEASVQELEYQAEVAERIGADVLNIHAGGAFGDKPKALETLIRNLSRLSTRVRERLTLENDDTLFTPADLLPWCRAANVPLVYDVHHHRCNPDGWSVERATDAALSTWDREPMFHVSSPLAGWDGPKPRRHHDYIDLRDFPVRWMRLEATVEVEAKAKELAVMKLQKALSRRQKRLTRLAQKTGNGSSGR